MNPLTCSLLLLLSSASPAFAYSDPGSGLMILQLLGSALVGALFYVAKIKGWIQKIIKNKKND